MHNLKKIIFFPLAVLIVIAILFMAINFFKKDSPLEMQRLINNMDGSLEMNGKSDISSKSYAPEYYEQETSDRKVIKNGQLSVLVKEAEEAALKISEIARKLKGFVSNSVVYEVSQGNKAGQITIRVPAKDFDSALNEIKDLAIKVEKETINASDVTEQFVDLEARLKNFRAEEEQYLEIMKQADEIEDILQITSRLSNVRGNIERIEGQLKYLEDQVDMATISVNLISEADVEIFGIKWRPLFVIKQSFRDMISGLTKYVDSIIKFIFFLPNLILWLATIGLIGLVGHKAIKWGWNRFFRKEK